MKWKTVKLNSIADVASGHSAPKTFSSEGYPFIRAGSLEQLLLDPKSVNELERVSNEYVESNSIKVYPKGSIVFAKSGMSATKNRYYQLSEDSCVVNHLAIIQPSNSIKPRFLKYYFQFFGTSRLIVDPSYPSIRISDIRKMRVPLPSLEIQKQIVEILDQADELRKKRQQTINRLDDLVKSTFIDMFGDPITNMHRFPAGTIRHLVEEVRYGTSSKAAESGEYPYLRMNNITYEGYMDYSDMKYINLSKKDFPKYTVRKNDLIFNRTNSKELVGKTGIFEEDSPMALAGYNIRIRTNKKANPYYIWAYLNSTHGKATLLNMCKSIVGMANINAQELQDIQILIPPIDLQNKFEASVAQIKKQKKLSIVSSKFFEDLYNVSLQDAFNGGLV